MSCVKKQWLLSISKAPLYMCDDSFLSILKDLHCVIQYGSAAWADLSLEQYMCMISIIGAQYTRTRSSFQANGCCMNIMLGKQFQTYIIDIC